MILLAALALAAAPHSHPAHKPVAHAKASTDWSRVTAVTPAGGYVMGNPTAKVKLIEYGSLTCPHCRHFDEEGVAPLVANYVRGGKVSYEFRSYLLNGIDIPATLAAGCGGPGSFFAMLRALYAAQPQWTAKIQAIPAARMKQIQAMPPGKQFEAIGLAAGFPAIAAAHGIPAARATACLNNQARAEQLAKATADATNRLKVEGTPTFFVNGATVDYSNGPTVWGAVEARLAAALRG